MLRIGSLFMRGQDSLVRNWGETTVKERDLVKHADWREIVAALTSQDKDRLFAVARLYDVVCGIPTNVSFDRLEIEAAQSELGMRTVARFARARRQWDRNECANLMMLRGRLSRTYCDAYIDMEIMSKAEAGEVPGFEPE
jgi:hypothetical protein